MKPLCDNVLIKRDPLPENKVGSIYLPDDNPIVKYPSTGYVADVGLECKYDLKDKRVMFGDNAYQYLDKEKDLILVREKDILFTYD